MKFPVLPAARIFFPGILLSMCISAMTASAQSSATHGAQPQPGDMATAQPVPPSEDPAAAPPFRGQVVVQPPEAERVFGFNPVNKALERYGLALYDLSQDLTFTYNLLSPPVPLADQTYNGQRPTFSSSHYPALTYDMRALHLHGAQLLIQGSIQRTVGIPAARRRPVSARSLTTSRSSKAASR